MIVKTHDGASAEEERVDDREREREREEKGQNRSTGVP